LRRAHPIFRLETADQVRQAVKFLDDYLGLPVPPGCLEFLIEDVTGRDAWARALVLFNAQPRALEFAIPAGAWKIFADNRRAGNTEILQSAAKVSDGRVTVPARSALILGELFVKTIVPLEG
jgi:hypothetical protein